MATVAFKKDKSAMNLLPMLPKEESKSFHRFYLPVFVFGVAISSVAIGLAIFTTIRLQHINSELNQLKGEYQNLHTIINDNGLVDDIQKFENYDEENFQEENISPMLSKIKHNDETDYADEYDSSYEENEADPIANANTNHEEVPNKLLLGGNLIKIGVDNHRTRRSIEDIAYTAQGVPINPLAYSQVKRKNQFSPTATGQPQRADRIASASASSDEFNAPDASRSYVYEKQPITSSLTMRQSRVLNVADKPLIAKKPQIQSLLPFDDESQWNGAHGWRSLANQNGFLPTFRYYNQIQSTTPALIAVRDEPLNRRRRPQRPYGNIELMEERRVVRMKPQPAVQLSGDTSKYVVGEHDHYNGDGHIAILNSSYSDWKMDSWVKNLGMDQHFSIHSNKIKIKENGLYFIYSQIFYNDEHDRNGYRVYKNVRNGERDVLILQCTAMSVSDERMLKSSTCYTAGVDYLEEGDEIFLRDIGKGRYTLFEPGKSFFGLLKLGDVRMK